MYTQDWRHVEGPVIACYAWHEERHYASLVEAVRACRPSYWDRRVPRYYRDQYGIVIPAWKVEEVAALNPSAPRAWGGLPYAFRLGPVPGVRKGRSGWRHTDRKIATTAERRENDFLFYDEDAIEYRIQPRPARGRTHLPHSWDDPRYARRGNGWKNHRKTQYQA